MLKSAGSDARGFVAKVSDFGLSVRMDPSETHVSNVYQVLTRVLLGSFPSWDVLAVSVCAAVAELAWLSLPDTLYMFNSHDPQYSQNGCDLALQAVALHQPMCILHVPHGLSALLRA